VAVYRKTPQEINHDSGAQSPAPKISVKNYMLEKVGERLDRMRGFIDAREKEHERNGNHLALDQC